MLDRTDYSTCSECEAWNYPRSESNPNGFMNPSDRTIAYLIVHTVETGQVNYQLNSTTPQFYKQDLAQIGPNHVIVATYTSKKSLADAWQHVEALDRAHATFACGVYLDKPDSRFEEAVTNMMAKKFDATII